MIKSVAEGAGELQFAFPSVLAVQAAQVSQRLCCSVTAHQRCSAFVFFPKILPHSPVRAFCFPPRPMMLFQLFVPVLPHPAQPEFLGHLCKKSPKAPAMPQCWTKFLMVCQDQEDPGISMTENPHGSAQNLSKAIQGWCPKKKRGSG